MTQVLLDQTRVVLEINSCRSGTLFADVIVLNSLFVDLLQPLTNLPKLSYCLVRFRQLSSLQPPFCMNTRSRLHSPSFDLVAVINSLVNVVLIENTETNISQPVAHVSAEVHLQGAAH